jgi:hypothetical protein
VEGSCEVRDNNLSIIIDFKNSREPFLDTESALTYLKILNIIIDIVFSDPYTRVRNMISWFLKGGLGACKHWKQ